MHPDVPYFSILLCLTPDDFTCQVESAVTQWVQVTMCILPDDRQIFFLTKKLAKILANEYRIVYKRRITQICNCQVERYYALKLRQCKSPKHFQN
jgi:hypothetical protein